MNIIVRILPLLALILSISVVKAQIFENKTITFNVETVVGEDKKDAQALGLKYVILFSNDTIYPLLISEGTSNKEVIPYQMEKEGEDIYVKYSWEGENQKQLIFTLNPDKIVTLETDFDFPIMFFDYQVHTMFEKETELPVFGDMVNCYRFRITDFPVDGYSIVYVDQKTLLPIQYEVYSYTTSTFTKSKTLKYYTSIKLRKIVDADFSLFGADVKDE